MNREILEINYNIYLKMLEKGNVDNEYIRTYKLIYQLINKEYIVESYALIRMLYEEILYDLAIKTDSNFKITVKTEASEIRNQVINNISVLFDEFIDKEYIKSLYNYLSKMTHENTIKEVLKDMIKNSRFINFLELNTLYMLIIIEHFYLSNIYNNQEIKELIDYLFIISTVNFTKEEIKLNSRLDKEEFDRYSNYFVDIKDKNYLEKTKNDLKESLNDLNNGTFDNSYNGILKITYELLNKYNYYKFYDKFVKDFNKRHK